MLTAEHLTRINGKQIFFLSMMILLNQGTFRSSFDIKFFHAKESYNTKLILFT